MRRRIIRQIFPPFLALIAGAFLVVGWISARAVREHQMARVLDDLTARNRIAQGALPVSMAAGDRLADVVSAAARAAPGMRFTVVATDGEVLADSAFDAAAMANHGTRPEVAGALLGNETHHVRRSDTTGIRTLYVALPVLREGAIAGVFRTAYRVDDVDAIVGSLQRRIAISGMAVAAAGILLALFVSLRIASPLRHLETAAQRFATGKLDQPVPLSETREIAEVADAMNRMAAELRDRIALVERQRAELEVLLSSLGEGVVAVDADEHVLTVNPRGGELLGVDGGAARGRDVREVIRHPDLQAVLLRALRTSDQAETDAILRGDREIYLHCRAVPLRDTDGSVRGAVMVMNDLTQIHRLMAMRRDFVANVSHELKTPLTAIGGFVETLLDPTPPAEEDRVRFLTIIQRQVFRLQALVDDLLGLARIEQQADQGVLDKTPAAVESVIAEAVDTCQPAAQERKVEIDVSVPPGLSIPMDADRIERALVNLIDNAVKFSPSGGRVRVECREVGAGVECAVIDSGCGIEARHLPRIFERFYRVDRARSRRDGGTGLGLAIVKHIVQAHGGRMSVDSKVGEGSRFSFVLPAAAPARTTRPNGTKTIS